MSTSERTDEDRKAMIYAAHMQFHDRHTQAMMVHRMMSRYLVSGQEEYLEKADEYMENHNLDCHQEQTWGF